MWLKNAGLFLFQDNWKWWLAGILLGLTIFAFIWVTGRLFGVSGCYADVCDLPKTRKMNWKIWFLVGMVLGGAIAHLYTWNWTFLYGRLDALSMGNTFFKLCILFVGGVLLGFGARYGGGCTSGHTIMGIAQRSWMSVVATLVFLVSGIAMAHLLIGGM